MKAGTAAVQYADLELAFEFVSAGAPMENEAWLCRESGAIHWHSGFGDNDEELPEDVGSEKYIAIPHKKDLGLGKPLVLRFTDDVIPELMSEVQEIFSRRGAYARFKNMLERHGKLQQWYDYEAQAERRALHEWCEDNGVAVGG